MSIQGSINSMIGSASHAISIANRLSSQASSQAPSETAQTGAAPAQPHISVQQQAAQRAKQSAADAVEAKRTQRRNFMTYLQQRPAMIGDLSPDAQKSIAKRYSPSQRQRIMNAADKEKQHGKH